MALSERQSKEKNGYCPLFSAAVFGVFKALISIYFTHTSGCSTFPFRAQKVGLFFHTPEWLRFIQSFIGWPLIKAEQVHPADLLNI